MIFLVLLDIVYILVRLSLWFAREIFYIYSNVYTFLKYKKLLYYKMIYILPVNIMGLVKKTRHI
jgi:hypothetical protein